MDEANNSALSAQSDHTRESVVVTTSPALTDTNGLTWSMDRVRDLFKTRRMWPTFVGTKITQYGVMRITPPVLLWNEQKAYLAEGNSKTDVGRKRRLDDCNGDAGTESSEAKTIRSNTTREDEQTHDLQFQHSPAQSIQAERPAVRSTATEATTHAPVTASTARKGGTAEQNVRNAVFRDIHEKGFFLGPADVYGGDYSLYKGGGDPTRTHSVATVRVVSRGHKISARELLAFSRVQNQVAKSAVFAFVSDNTRTDTSTHSAAQSTVSCSKNELQTGHHVSDEALNDSDMTSAGRSASKSNCECGDEVQGVVPPKYIVINFRNVSDRV